LSEDAVAWRANAARTIKPPNPNRPTHAKNDVKVFENAVLGAGMARSSGTVLIGPGGVLSPGNSIGKVTIEGNLNQEDAWYFDVEGNPNGHGSYCHPR
jgi:hypothetical protein